MSRKGYLRCRRTDIAGCQSMDLDEFYRFRGSCYPDASGTTGKCGSCRGGGKDGWIGVQLSLFYEETQLNVTGKIVRFFVNMKIIVKDFDFICSFENFI